MKLKVIEKGKKNTPSTNKGKKQRKPKRVKGTYLFNPLNYAYELNEKVVINEEGLKQITNLKKDYYRVVAIREVSLQDMTVNVMDLNVEDDENIKNPYLAHHFNPLEPNEDSK